MRLKCVLVLAATKILVLFKKDRYRGRVMAEFESEPNRYAISRSGHGLQNDAMRIAFPSTIDCC